MRLLIEARQYAEQTVIPEFLNAGLLLKASVGKEASLKRLKKGDHIYLYITDDGDIGHTCGILKSELSSEVLTDPRALEKNATYAYTIEPAYTTIGSEAQKKLHAETLQLKGSRVQPTSLEVKKVALESYTENGKTSPYVFVTGRLFSAHDKRRDYLSPDESTHWGSGLFNFKSVKGIYDGCFVNLTLSPWADEISKVVDMQRDAYAKLTESLQNKNSTAEERATFKKSFEFSQKLLRPHANEIYGYQDAQELLFINGQGCWQSEYAPALRDLDEYDITRIHKFLVKEKYSKEELLARRERLGTESISERFYLDTLAPALAPEVSQKAAEASSKIETQQKKQQALSPKLGPLGSRDLCGLREGVELIPHQAMILASLRDRKRMVVDADAGAGKTIIIICDILQQMKKGTVHRPLVVMPERLLAQFAQEVLDFSELNPWIINTDSIKRWQKKNQEALKEGEEFDVDDSLKFFEGALSAPPNTVFLTSYNWIAREFSVRPTGEMQKGGGYRTAKIYKRPVKLIDDLGIDGLYADECHILKNASGYSWAATVLSEIPTVRMFTGTIMPGNLGDVTGPMGAVHSSVFGTENDFLRDFTEGMSIYNYKKEAPKQIRKRLKDFGMVSVRRSAWMHLLPKIIKEYHYVNLSPTQKKAYRALLENILEGIKNDPKLSKLLKKFEDTINADLGEEVAIGPLLSRFAPLDVFINAPAKTKVKNWVKNEDEANKMFSHLMVGEDAKSPKSKAVNSIIRKHLAMPDHGKVLVLVQYKEAALNLLDNLDEEFKVHADYYDAGHVDVLSRFKNPKDLLNILFAVDASIVLGHNIQAANCVIHADHKWVAGDMAQREARAIRPKQQRDVYVHHILANDTAEMLKMARIISTEHMVAKANSDFDDDVMLQPIRMTLKDMRDFKDEKQLEPFIEARHSIEKKALEASKKEREFYGNSLLKPAGYSSIKETFTDAKIAPRLPSTKEFERTGDVVDPNKVSLEVQNSEKLKEKELEALPKEPSGLTSIPLGFYQRNNDWYLYAFKLVDPQGYLRRFKFNLTLPYYYYTLNNKGEVSTVIKRLGKAGVTLSNEEQLTHDLAQERTYQTGTHRGLVRLLQKAKRSKITGKVFTLSLDEIEMQYIVVDGMPMLFVEDIFSKEAVEAKALKSIGFDYGPALWQKRVTRSVLAKTLKDFITRAPQLKISEWDLFKDEAHKIFKGLNLIDFDVLGEK